MNSTAATLRSRGASLVGGAAAALGSMGLLAAAPGLARTKRIWVPDVVSSRRIALLSTLEVGDQIFVNASLLGTKVFGNAGNGALALTAAEF